jgi:hypothetical protein
VDSSLLHLQVWCSLYCRARSTSERSLEDVEPFPGLAGAKSSKEERRLPSRSHQSAYRRGTIHYESHPAPPPITRRAVCTKVDSASGGKSTWSLGVESEHSPSSSRLTRRSSKRLDRIFPRQMFNQMARSRQTLRVLVVLLVEARVCGMRFDARVRNRCTSKH